MIKLELNLSPTELQLGLVTSPRGGEIHPTSPLFSDTHATSPTSGETHPTSPPFGQIKIVRRVLHLQVSVKIVYDMTTENFGHTFSLIANSKAT